IGSWITPVNRAGAISPGAGIAPPARAPSSDAPTTRRIGWAKLLAVYWVIGLGSGAPQSQAGARRTAWEANRWMAIAHSPAEAVMNASTKRPLYELLVSAIGTIESHAWPSWAGMRPPTVAWAAGARASMTRPGSTPASRHRAVRMNMAPSENASVSRADAAAGVRGRPRKVIPNALTKQAAARAADRARTAPTAGASSFRAQASSRGLSRMAWKVIPSEQNPL